ncbi:hypothetical protein BDV96DRAFT_218335 [Lophiotrema nucula]|uniref:Myb-like domain-containing protein n=1 Tax=Lophiotrema nucula TaxID=690887 RepID=A0A6A5ZTY3_9PLEO|nr:hypothetical protein BDV96DRAFT_218335 [Lophiotrema nucula]
MGGDRPQTYGPQPGQKLKISKSYLFGLTDTPFKLVGRPNDGAPAHVRKKSGAARFAEMLTTPGAGLEWVASDGRKGGLTKSLSPAALTASNLKKLPVADPTLPPIPANTGAPNAMPANSANGGGNGGLGDLAALSGKLAQVAAARSQADMADNGHAWTTAQDAKLMELKNENTNWKDIASQMNVEEQACRDRFKEIKPADWKPNQKGGKGGGGGKQAGKQGGGKNKGGGENNAGGGGPGPVHWNNNAPAANAPAAANGWGAPQQGPTGWGTTAPPNYTQAANPNPWAQQPNAFAQNNAAAPVAAAPAAPAAPLEAFIDIYPDNNFDMDDLMRIAKIMQEDQERLWLRVSSRFFDHTGRHIAPATFERKLTGKVDNGSVRGGSIRGTVRDV